MSSWQAEAGNSAFYGKSGRGASKAKREQEYAVVGLASKAPIGFIRYKHKAGDAVEIVFLAIEPALRGWGYGSEAVRLLEEHSLREGWGNSFQAEVPAHNGLNLYFWLRLGYRPVRTEDKSGEVLMVRRTQEGPG